MDEALVEHAENDVDHDQRRRDQSRLACQRRLKGLGVALEGWDDGGRHADFTRRLVDGVDRLAERDAGCRLKVSVTAGNCP